MLMLLATVVLKLRHLDHTALTRWDEVFHAVVAQNVLKHPFEPTLVDVPYLPHDANKWGETHIWLHKPILPFWQIAVSFALLGVTTFALRLPSVLLSTGAAWLTYLIGKELFDRRAALLAAGLQAVNPFLLTLVQAYEFADHIDVALLFWVEVGVYFLVRALRTASWTDVLLAGVAQGLAFLCKSYLAFIILGVALTAWLLPLVGLGKRADYRIGPARLLGLLGATMLTAGPWLVSCLVRYPRDFWQEEAHIWKHLSGNIETWAAPWDRVVFDYLIVHYGVFYTPILVAGVALLGQAFGRRHKGLLLAYAWGLGVIVPHVLAVTKTPSATILAIPAMLLLLAHLVVEAYRGERGLLMALCAILAMSLAFPAVIKKPGYGYPTPRVFAGVLQQTWWVVDQLAGTLAIVAVLAIVAMLFGGRVTGAPARYLRLAAVVFCTFALAWLGWQTVAEAWRVTSLNAADPACRDMGQFVHGHLPANAVLLCEERKNYEHLSLMFYADRTCYGLRGRRPEVVASEVVQAGGAPYVVSYRSSPVAPLHVSDTEGLSLYLWQP
jgi:4-amino-4-deoxy-L-arabinose transferase